MSYIIFTAFPHKDLPDAWKNKSHISETGFKYFNALETGQGKNGWRVEDCGTVSKHGWRTALIFKGI